MKMQKYPIYLQLVKEDCSGVEHKGGLGDQNIANIADRVEAEFGKNAYSDFLRKHGHYPDVAQAATIGKLLGGRVRASDGSMQPPLSKADREAIKAIRRRRKDWKRIQDHLYRVNTAISALSVNEDEPETVARYFREHSSVPDSMQLEAAISWLNRFAEELRRNESQCSENADLCKRDHSVERWPEHRRNSNENEKEAS
ncbi:hypothetical protein FM996_00515 [Methylosinus sporium]|uniref:Uncharacterized protein n=1 Tax=Methylosinus sporium TaxID=428 RepID=A0A549T909_METSR|nr:MULTISPECIES: hypothetical protein [Methylosinus]MBU3887720.1 hypothetical protein [Methylosinus sp. KRF6]TRL38346.1 hypothetical protein FM996_00515 [Methylosinus sporium]